ncbi:MAG: hypothetical protein ACK494_06295, partial [Planctomycetota bacterium]
VIPVDWTYRAMTHVLLSPKCYEHTFHLAPEQCITPREIIEAAYRYFHSSGVEYVGYQKLDPETYNDFEREFLPGVTMYNDYEATDPLFDCSNLKRFAGHIPCPAIDEAMLHRFLRFGEEDRWGKRRSRKPEFDSSVLDMLQSCDSAIDSGDRSKRPRVSLDLVGPGGSQWTVGIGPQGNIFSVPGLDGSAMLNAQMSVKDFKSAILQHRLDGDLESLFAKWIHALCGQHEIGTRVSRGSSLPIQVCMIRGIE